MAIYFTKEEYDKLCSIPMLEGKHSKFKITSLEDRPCYIKKFYRTSGYEEAFEQISRLLSKSPIENSGYPLEEVMVDDKKIGYLCTCFPYAYSFYYAITTNLAPFSIEEKIKAVLDIKGQLEEFHNQGFIFNDIQLTNFLIDHEGGHLIDFEDSLVKSSKQEKITPLLFYKVEDGTLKLRMPSFNEDRRKFAFTAASFLLGTDLEYPLYMLQDRGMLLSEYFGVDSKLNEMMHEIFFQEEIPDFSEYLPLFEDSEKNDYNKKKINKKIEKQLINWYR